MTPLYDFTTKNALYKLKLVKSTTQTYFIIHKNIGQNHKVGYEKKRSEIVINYNVNCYRG